MTRSNCAVLVDLNIVMKQMKLLVVITSGSFLPYYLLRITRRVDTFSLQNWIQLRMLKIYVYIFKMNIVAYSVYNYKN